MTTQNHHKTIVRRLYEEAINHGRIEVAEELSTTAIARSLSTIPIKAACPDTQFEVEDLIAEGDKVAVRWTARGTHTAEFLGAPPTDHSIELHGTAIYRFEGGRVVETWPMVDRLGVLQQLGVLPALPPLASPITPVEKAG